MTKEYFRQYRKNNAVKIRESQKRHREKIKLEPIALEKYREKRRLT